MQRRALKKIAGLRKSVTFYFNATFAALAAILPDLIQVIPELQPLVGPEVYRHLLILNILGNVLIRGRTSKPLEDK